LFCAIWNVIVIAHDIAKSTNNVRNDTAGKFEAGRFQLAQGGSCLGLTATAAPLPRTCLRAGTVTVGGGAERERDDV
jgi:hypothetical protein